MATDYDLAAGVRAALAGVSAVREVKMFGGIGFMLNGNLLAGASKRGLLVRVGRASQRKALSRSGARPLVMRGRTMVDYIYVDPPALNDRAVRAWLSLALEFVGTLPPKTKAKTKVKTKAKTKAETKAKTREKRP